jgi:hypothetical protein
MIYFKSILAGLLAVFVFAILAVAGSLAWQFYQLLQQGYAAGSWSFNSNWISIWWYFAAALLIFAAGFYWQFRRASRR